MEESSIPSKKSSSKSSSDSGDESSSDTEDFFDSDDNAPRSAISGKKIKLKVKKTKMDRALEVQRELLRDYLNDVS